ncbi:acetolactate synthase AlsS [Methylococcus sp. ANG]|uniref:acetolactate synthase AlsS n=1 Tax=Methylococcus sp. ANG TaxID=3231903 RepID=UPI0034587FA7
MTETSMPRTGADLLVDSLQALDVQYVFGVPGGAILPILNVLAERGPRFIVCRDETGAAFMAQAWGRITGQPGVVLTTSGPGLINAVCGVATATEDRDPLVVITGQVPRAVQFKQSHMNLDSVGLFAPITKWSVEVEEPNTVSEILVNAFRVAQAPRCGAVHVSVPNDMLTAPVSVQALAPPDSACWGTAPDNVIERAAALLDTAEDPAILLGVRAGTPPVADAVRRFLSRHPLPVAMTFEAAGTLSRDLVEHFVGRVGYVLNQPGDDVLRQADRVLAIGYDPIEYEPSAWVSPRSQVIHLDALPATLDRAYRPAAELLGDIADNLDALGSHLQIRAPAERPAVTEARRRLLEEQGRGAALAGAPIHPLRFIHDLRATLDDEVTVTCDVGAHEIWMARYFFCYAPRHLLFSMGHQTMGVALPWAIGAALARPGKKVVSVSGDGSFLMTCMELETAVRLKLPIVHVVWKDGGYNLIHSLQMRDYGRSFGAEFGPTDFVKLAEAFGATGYRIESADDVVPVLKQALVADTPVLIEVPIDYSDNADLVDAINASAQH